MNVRIALNALAQRPKLVEEMSAELASENWDTVKQALYAIELLPPAPFGGAGRSFHEAGQRIADGLQEAAFPNGHPNNATPSWHNGTSAPARLWPPRAGCARRRWTSVLSCAPSWKQPVQYDNQHARDRSHL
jgi:hypothetical protein